MRRVLRRGGHQAAELVDGPDPLLACAAPGDAQHPDGLHTAASCLGQSLGPPRQGGSSRFHRVDGIGLARPTALLAVRAVYLDDAHVVVVKVTGQAGAVAAGALDATMTTVPSSEAKPAAADTRDRRPETTRRPRGRRSRRGRRRRGRRGGCRPSGDLSGMVVMVRPFSRWVGMDQPAGTADRTTTGSGTGS